LEARGKQGFRAEQLIDAERQFRFQVPAGARLALKVERDKSGLRIEEFRVAAGQFRFCSWTDGASDADVGIVRVILEATAWGAVGATGVIVASISLHALGRRFQRGFNNTDEAILLEMRELALWHAGIVEVWGNFAIAGDGGTWCGEVARTQIAEVSCPVLAIRTFAPAGAPVRGVAFAAAAIGLVCTPALQLGSICGSCARRR
jgi:hypothetical protein